MEQILDDSLQVMQVELNQRKTIIAALYLRRKSNPGQPAITLSELEELLGVPKDQFEFSLWYLIGGDFIKRGDNGSTSILLKGVDLAESVIRGGTRRDDAPTLVRVNRTAIGANIE
jgi:hypothetical protein